MDQRTTGWTLGELAVKFGGKLSGPSDRVILRPSPAGTADPSGLTFAESAKYLAKAASVDVGAILVGPGMGVDGVATIEVAQPRAIFGLFLSMNKRELPLNFGVHPTAVVDPTVDIPPSTQIGPNVTIEKGAKIGEKCRIYSGVYVGEDCVLGDGVTIYPNVVLTQDVHIGSNSILHSGCVIGADGFGYAFDGKIRQKIPQVGGVRIGANVEIGACTCIDRATCGNTIIEDGTKLDNLVQIGHNSRVGAHTVIAGHTSVAGSVNIGSLVTSGGQTAFKEHVKVADGVAMGGRTGVMADIESAGEYWGTPAMPIRDALRQMSLMRKLPEMAEKIKELEKKIAALENAK